MQGLTELLVDALESLIARGFQFPIYAASLATNGCTIVIQYEPNEEGTLDASIIAASESERMQLPINIMFVDSTGDAVRMRIERPDEKPVWIQ